VALLARPELHGPAHKRVRRPLVDELLDRAVEGPICVVVGAAGWGKTTTVATWSYNRPTAWLRYEDYEGGAEHLLASLVKVLQAHVPVSAPFRSSALLDAHQGRQSVEAICDSLSDVLDKDLVLVLDDLQELGSGSDAAGIVESLCSRTPDRLHVVLISRRDPPFSLQRLRGRGLVAEIDAPDFALDVADLEALLRQTVGRDPPGLARHLWDSTGGWAAAVHCAVEMLRGVDADQRLGMVRRLSDPGERFHDYLAEEVVGAAHDHERQLMNRLAILGEIRSAMEIGNGLDDPTSVLAELSRQGLVLHTGGDVGWALVRPLQHFFEHKLAPSASEWKALHAAVAKEWIERKTPAEALRHLLAADDHAAFVSILADHGSAMVERGDLAAVLQATDLPAEYLDDPQIQQVLGQAQQVRGQWTDALQHFQRAGRGRDELEPALAWGTGLIAFAQGEFTGVQALTRRTRMDREDTLEETRVLALLASTHRMTGDLVSLRKVAGRARAAAQRCGDPRAWSSVHHVFALLSAADGNWRQVDAHCTDALRSAEAGQDLLQLAWTRVCRAFHQFEAGAPRHALADAEIALNLSERCENPFYVAHALTTRGRARSRLGMLDEAAADFTTAIDLLRRIGSRFLAWPLCGLGDVHRTRGQLIRAQAAYEEALALAEPCHDVFGLSSALMGLARIATADDFEAAHEYADRAVGLGEGLRSVAALLTRGWVKLMGHDRHGASVDANQAAVAARQRRDEPGLAEAITLNVLASSDPSVGAAALREAIDIWHETGCRIEEAATTVVAARIDAPIHDLDTHLADQMLRDHGIDVDSRRIAGPLGVLVRSTPGIFIQTLGAFRVVRDGFPVPNTAWKSKKARDLLKVLVARRRPTPREQLIDLLWPEVDPALAGNRLSVLLSAVREVLQPHPSGESPLVTIDGAVSLNPRQVRVDVEEFLTQATAALDADRAKAPDATARLASAVTAYTGGFLEDDPYQDWAVALAEEIRATHIALLRALAARLRDALDTDSVVRYTLRLLEQDCYDEEAHLNLVGVLLGAGHLGQARRHYKNYVRRMKEIGVQPRPLRDIPRPEIMSR
jgi:ATP/maltotriose-dependent transcriptional regulator MalT/DNA-binding SARP family transcriptional activator